MVSLRFRPFNLMRLDPDAPIISIKPYWPEGSEPPIAMYPVQVPSLRSDQVTRIGGSAPLAFYDPRVATGNRGADAGSQTDNGDPDSDLGDDMPRGRSRTSVRGGMTADTRLALLEDDMDSVHHVLQDANKMLNRLFIVGISGVITFTTSIILLAFNIAFN